MPWRDLRLRRSGWIRRRDEDSRHPSALQPAESGRARGCRVVPLDLLPRSADCGVSAGTNYLSLGEFYLKSRFACIYIMRRLRGTTGVA
jgi:hypothetical protein